MHEKSLLTLEYPKILAKVAKEAAFSASKELVMALEPTPNIEEAQSRLAYTTEAAHLIDLHPDAGVGSAHDVRPSLARAAREGVLSPSDLLEVLDTTRSAIHVARMLEKGVHYAEIAERTGASTATITRINTWRRFGAGGYRMQLDRQKARPR